MDNQVAPAAAQLLRDCYAAFNSRAVEEALALAHPRVDWPDAVTGGRLFGREQVRAYWLEQFAGFDPYLEPLSMRVEPDGRIGVEVHQVLCELTGRTLDEARVRHLYTLADGLIARLDVEPAPAG